jgi:phosphoribosylformylglycinamidine synthase
MLMVLNPLQEKEAEAIFRKWGHDFAIVGHTTDTLRFVVKHQGEVKADLPIKELGDQAPLYERPYVPTRPANPVDANWVRPPVDNRTALLRLLGSPNLCSKRWIWEQYDHLILGNTIVPPGADAAVVRIGDGPKGLALTTDVVARYCAADPVEGGRQVVAEAWRNLIAVGARPLAITDNLNFGNPERPEIMGQFVGCLQGIGEACRALDFPVVSGNVSLYNETRGQGILPTPAIGGVGVVDDVAKIATPAFKGEGHIILLIGKTLGWLGQSIYLSELCGREEGAPPPIDLAEERRHGDFVSAAIRAERVTAVHDLAEGGLGVALAEMAIDGGVGARIDRLPDGAPAHGVLFGEGQGRYLLTATQEAAEALVADAEAAGVPVLRLGEAGGDALTLPDTAAIPVSELVRAHEDWLPQYMAGAPAPTN